MVKIVMKNYIKQYKYFFILLGFFILGGLVSGLIFYLGVYLPLVSHENLINEILSSFSNTISNMKATSFLSGNFFKEMFNDVTFHFEGIDNSTVITVIISLLLTVLSFIGIKELSEWFCRRNLRKNFENKDTIKGIFAALIRALISLVFWTCTVILTYLWSYTIFLIPIGTMMLNTFKEIVSAYFIYFRKKEFKQIMTTKTYFKSLSLQFAITIFEYIGILIAISNLSTFYLFLIVVPFVSYSSVIVHITIIEYLQKEKGTR